MIKPTITQPPLQYQVQFTSIADATFGLRQKINGLAFMLNAITDQLSPDDSNCDVLFGLRTFLDDIQQHATLLDDVLVNHEPRLHESA